MKVKELIELLQKQPQENEIRIHTNTHPDDKWYRHLRSTVYDCVKTVQKDEYHQISYILGNKE